MSKFNLVNYVKIDGHGHIEDRLKKEHKDESNEISEGQLEVGRVAEKDEVIEKLLDKVRSASDIGTIERRLNVSNSPLTVHRNEATHIGDINKLEEQRMENKTQKIEKYELASETPKKLRWWEKSSPDGLKLASNEIKKAQSWGIGQDEDDEFSVKELDFDKPRFEDIIDPEERERLVDDEVDDDDKDMFGDLKDFEGLIESEGDFQEEEFIANTDLELGRGKLKFTGSLDILDEDAIVQDATEFIAERHPEVDISEDSFDLSDLGSGIIKYIAPLSPTTEASEASEEFDVDDIGKTLASNVKFIEVTSKKKMAKTTT